MHRHVDISDRPHRKRDNWGRIKRRNHKETPGKKFFILFLSIAGSRSGSSSSTSFGDFAGSLKVFETCHPPAGIYRIVRTTTAFAGTTTTSTSTAFHATIISYATTGASRSGALLRPFPGPGVQDSLNGKRARSAALPSLH